MSGSWPPVAVAAAGRSLLLAVLLVTPSCGQVAPPNPGSQLGDPRSHLQLMSCQEDGGFRWPNDVGWQRLEYDPVWAQGKDYLVFYHLKDGGLVGSATGNCLAARGSRAGTAVSRGQCGGSGAAAQAWLFRHGAVVHNASGLCLATKNGSAAAPGVRVVLDDCASSRALAS